MSRTLLIAACILATTLEAPAQSPGIDPRGVAARSSIVVIGTSEKSWQMVFRPDRIAKTAAVKVLPDGRSTAQLPEVPSDYIVGFIYRIKIEEVLKHDRLMRPGDIIEVFVPYRLEGGVSLPPNSRFVVSLSPLQVKKEDFVNTLVNKPGESLKKASPFRLAAHYYTVQHQSGAIMITNRNQKLIEEIRSAVREPFRRY